MLQERITHLLPIQQTSLMLCLTFMIKMVLKASGADVTDAIDHHKQLETARLAAIAQQAWVHLDSIASQTLPIAHVRAEKRL